MNLAQKLLAKRYLDPIKAEPELFIGVELEYPIVNTKGEATDTHISKSLMYYNSRKAGFSCGKKGPIWQSYPACASKRGLYSF